MIRNIPFLTECEVLIVGGGPAGALAGIASAREGARTIIVEKNGFLGGNLTAAGIDTIYGLFSVGENPEKTIGGIIDEVIEKLEDQNACYLRPNTYGAGTGLTFSGESLKIILELLALSAGVKIYYHTIAPDVYYMDNQLVGCMVASKSGIQWIKASVIVDCTGDADVVAKAGGGVEKAGDFDSIQSCTTVFYMANVDVKKAKDFGKNAMWEAMKEATNDGEYKLPRIEGSFHETPNPGLIEANMTRIANVDTTSMISISDAEVEGRRQVQEYVRFLIEKVPGFEDSYLVKTGCQIGVREARRVIGDYILQKEDVLDGRKFIDAVVRCGQPIEDHHSGKDTRWVYVKDFGYYEIPYRSLIPKGLDNVLTAGRCLSASHDAHASARSSGTAMGMGQAVGLAAVMALEKENNVRGIDVSELRNKLIKIGAPL
jgi:ribulose 1,5-bisphosphate synthetase/thiazole synthase